MASQPRIPTATYRLQLNRNFTFNQASEIIPYLDRLGISDIYSSPFYRSRSDSAHGYDVTNHNELNPAIGTLEDFAGFTTKLKEHGMGHITDFVPNHMGIVDPSNEWWMDVLENGPSSAYAPFFDIDWEPIKENLRNKVLLPVLGDQYGRVLERGEFHVQFRDGAFFVTYYDFVFPINPRTYPQILRITLDKLGRYSDEDMYFELESILSSLEHLPSRSDTTEDKVRERAREKEVVKRRIARLCAEYPQVGDAIEGPLNHLEGRVGHPRSFDGLHELLSAQAYRLSYWRVAAEEINYRRFFDVNELAAIRVENPKVFATIHQWLFQMMSDGTVTGVRIDHIDGLHDPKEYLEALQRRSLSDFDADGEPENPDKRFYLIVEKILSEEERLRTDWPVHGTTGYDFASDATQLLVDSSHADRFSRIYRDFIDRYVHFESLMYEKKKLVMDVTLSSDVESLGHLLSGLAERDRMHRDFTLDSLSGVVRELIACFPVYRTYIDAETGVSETDRLVILRAVRAAKRRNAAIDASIFDRLTALNEVGGNPRQFGISTEHFHERNRLRLAETPHTFLTLTTHDTKRSEDVRARIAVLSEIPAEWEAWLKRWRKLTSHARTDLEGETAPSANEEYLYYQTLLGTWPVDQAQEHDAYVSRIQRYMLKAIKEAKVNSSWIQPNEDWENAVRHYVEETLKPQGPLCSSLLPAAEKVAWHGMLNSLAQTILKLTCPGVPDFYQGSELWDLRLVDPDNRDPVDYAAREKGLARIEESDIPSLFKEWKDGLIKLAIIRLLLQLRQREPRLFQSGIYSSLYAAGSKKDCCVAFHRRLEEKSVLVIVPRLTTKLGQPGESPDWDDAQLLIDESLPEMQDLFSKRTFKKGADQISLKSLGELPFAVFHT